MARTVRLLGVWQDQRAPARVVCSYWCVQSAPSRRKPRCVLFTFALRGQGRFRDERRLHGDAGTEARPFAAAVSTRNSHTSARSLTACWCDRGWIEQRHYFAQCADPAGHPSQGGRTIHRHCDRLWQRPSGRPCNHASYAVINAIPFDEPSRAVLNQRVRRESNRLL
jgi:hypothetical protein